MTAEAIMQGAAAANGRGVTNATSAANTPVHSATRADPKNLSGALLTSEFHSACSSAAPSTAAHTNVVTAPPPRPSQNCHDRS